MQLYTITREEKPATDLLQRSYVHRLLSPRGQVVRTMCSYSPVAPEALRKGQAVGNTHLLLDRSI